MITRCYGRVRRIGNIRFGIFNGRIFKSNCFLVGVFFAAFFRWILTFRCVFTLHLAPPGEGTGFRMVIRLFTNITQNVIGAVRSEMAKLFAVTTNNSMACVDIVASLLTVMTAAWLVFITKMDLNSAKTNEIWDGLFNTDAITSYTILNVFLIFFTEIATALVDNITIFRQPLDDSGIRHLMWGIKNLNIA